MDGRSTAASDDPRLSQQHLFVGGEGGYHTYRIPALASTPGGALLAFCEGRKHSAHDYGEIDLVLRRSFDGGNTWQEMQVIVSEPDMTCGNPCPVVSQTTGTIWLPFCKNLADGHQGLIMAGKAPRTVWLTCSSDDGASWADPWEITAAVKHPAWTWIGTGPCHGIQLDSGRLVVPSHYAVGRNFNTGDPYHSCVIYSDDEGASWRMGGSVGEGTDECAVVQTTDGRLYINCRNPIGVKCRASAWSDDRGESFAPVGWDASLVEPDCQGSLARFTEAGRYDRDRVLFANPASLERARMGVRVSYDECLTWSEPQVLHAGPAAYSDLIAAPGRTACCLYECGEQWPYERITLARFNAAWIDAA